MDVKLLEFWLGLNHIRGCDGDYGAQVVFVLAGETPLKELLIPVFHADMSSHVA
jgi:hypothetical protein